MRIQWKEINLTNYFRFLRVHKKLVRLITCLIFGYLCVDCLERLYLSGITQIYKNIENGKAVVVSTIKTATERKLLRKQLEDYEKKEIQTNEELSEKNIVLEIIDFNKFNFDKNGKDISPKSRDPKNITRIVKATKKYEYIVKSQDSQGITMHKFMLCVVQEGCCFDPNMKYQNYLKDKKGKSILDKKGNKIPTTQDWGCGDMNECNHAWIEADPDMPKELKGRNWLDIEKSICARYIWFREEMKKKHSWMKLKRGWDLYARIKTL